MTQPIEPVANFAQFCGEWRETESASGQPLYTASALEAAKQEGRREGLEEVMEEFQRTYGRAFPGELRLRALIEKDST